MQREQKIRSGKLLEVSFYPIWQNGKRVPTRAPKSKPTSEEQRKYNQKRAVQNFVRMVNANFDTGDLFVHLTYFPDSAPETFEEAGRQVYNYIRRLKNRRATELKSVTARLVSSPKDAQLKEKKKKLSEPFRYYTVTESNVYKTGKYKGRSVWHFHIFMTGGLERDAVEDTWDQRARVNADRYQPERFGPEAAARYCAKDPCGRKRFCCSRNLKKPIVSKPRDGRITSRGVERLAKERIDDREYWEKKYRGYKFLRCVSRYNEYNASWYVYAVMYKSDGETDAPPWSMNEKDELLW